ncbi:hypothetical protein ACLOJK_015167, partial [Asimina triloba]
YTVCIAPPEHGAPVWCIIVFPNPTHLPSPAASSAAMIDGEHNTVRPDPGTANDARPPIMFLYLARSRRRSSSSSVHASTPIGSTIASSSATVSSLTQLAPSDPSLSDPCDPMLSSKRTISSFNFPHSTPQRHHGQPCQQLTQQASTQEPASAHISSVRPRAVVRSSAASNPPSQHASGRQTPPHHQQDMIFTIDPNGLHRAVHSAKVSSRFARSTAVRRHLHQQNTRSDDQQATSSSPQPQIASGISNINRFISNTSTSASSSIAFDLSHLSPDATCQQQLERKISVTGRPRVLKTTNTHWHARQTPATELEGMAPPSVMAQLKEELEASRAEVARLQSMLREDVI